MIKLIIGVIIISVCIVYKADEYMNKLQLKQELELQIISRYLNNNYGDV